MMLPVQPFQVKLPQKEPPMLPRPMQLKVPQPMPLPTPPRVPPGRRPRRLVQLMPRRRRLMQPQPPRAARSRARRQTGRPKAAPMHRAMRPKPQRHRQIRQRRQLIWRTRTRMALEKNLQMARRMSRRHLQKSPRHGGLVIKGNSHLDELFEIVWVLSLVTWDTHTMIL